MGNNCDLHEGGDSSGNVAHVEAAIKPVQAVVGFDEEAQQGLRRLLPPPRPSHQAAPRQLLQLDRHHGAGAVLLDVVLEALHFHGEHRLEAAEAVAAARSGLGPAVVGGR